MIVIGRVSDDLIGVGIQMSPEHPLVVGSGDGMPEMADDCVGVEQLAVPVPVEPPGIRSAVAEDLKRFRFRMKAPDRAVQRGALVGGRARSTDEGS